MSVRALPSSTEGHFHLYIDAEMRPDAHAAPLACLGDAGIIGADFLAMAERNGVSLLIRPGLTKTDLALRAVSAPRWESGY